MAIFSQYQLEHLKGLAETAKGVRQLREEKDKALNDLKKNDRTHHPKLDLTPKGDLYFQKPTYSNKKEPQEIEKEEQRINENYNAQIRETVKDDFQQNGYRELEWLDQVDVVELMEKGVDYILAKQELEAELKTTLDLDTEVSIEKTENIEKEELSDPLQDKFKHFDENAKDIDQGREREEF